MTAKGRAINRTGTIKIRDNVDLINFVDQIVCHQHACKQDCASGNYQNANKF